MKDGKLKRGDCDDDEEDEEEEKETEIKTSSTCRSNRDPHHGTSTSTSSNHRSSNHAKRRKLSNQPSKRNHRDAGADVSISASRSAAPRPPVQQQQQRLLGLIREFFEEGASEANVEPEMVQQLLEASSGDVDLAATFFWDQYVASGIHRQQQSEADRDLPSVERKRRSASKNTRSAHNKKETNKSAADEDEEEDARRIRRSLLGRFDESAHQRGAHDDDGVDNHHDQEVDDDDDDDAIVGHQVNDQQQPPPQPVAINDNPIIERLALPVDPEQVQVLHPPRIPVVAHIAHVEALVEEEAEGANNANMEADEAAIAGSVSVSDDEGGGIWRMERRRQAIQDDDAGVRRNIGIQQNNNEHNNEHNNHDNDHHNNDNGNAGLNVNAGGAARAAAAAIGPAVGDLRRHVSDRIEQQVLPNNNNNGDINALDTGIIPDVPMEEDHDDETYISDGDWLTSSPRNTSAPTPLPPLSVIWGKPPPIVDTNQDAPANVQDEEKDPDVSLKLTIIPHTWLHATFGMAPGGGGLIVKTPSEDDVAIFRWKQQQSGGGNDSRNFMLPPHHCKSVTAILAVVNATILTGASMQGNRVDCSSGLTPFVELTVVERVKEFESRLADALTALLFVALKASTARKTKALDARAKLAASKKNKNKQRDVADFFKMQKQKVARKLRLCPTCRWQKDATTGEPQLPEARAASRVRIVTSFTNISDLRSYVKSNMRSFTSRGGCALLLETIVRIHGKSTVKRMVRKSRLKLGLPVDATKKDDGLIVCTCHARHSTVRPPRLAGAPANTPILDTTPPGHECLSVELLSLLICGEVHSTFKDWPKENALGFGVLSNAVGEIGAQLKHPRKPVWILRGATSHTVTWIDPLKMPLFDMTQLDQSGTVLQLCHWNLWYDQRNLSGMRLITARGKWSPPGLSNSASGNGPYLKKFGKVVERIMQDKQQERQLASIVSTEEQDESKTANAITSEELEHLIVNPDDKSFYPKEYRRWRYKFSEAATAGWLGHNSLSERQRLIVEVKLAPNINSILWSRWPNSVVDKFTPEDESLPVV